MKTYKLKLIVVLMAIGMITACGKSHVKPGATANPEVPKAAANPDIKKSGIVSGTVWKLERIEQDAKVTSAVIDNPRQYTLTLFTNNSYQVKADCNRMQGAYTLDGNSIKIVPGAATLVECGPGSHYSEYLKYLTEAASFERYDDKMVLKLQNDGPNLVFGISGLIVNKP